MSEPTPPGPLVRVLWEDPREVEPGWSEPGDISRTVTRCLTVGWLLHESDDVLVLVAAVTDDRQVGTGMVIPTSAVIEWHDI